MPVISQIPRNLKAPTITTITTPATSGNEFSHNLQPGVKKIKIRVRGTADLELSYTPGFIGEYWSIFKGTIYEEDNLKISAGTIYLKCNKGSQVVEILEWV